MKTNKLTLYGMVIAITVVLNILFGVLSFGVVQIRISEILLVLCLFDKNFVFPLTIGCLLSNLIGFVLGTNVLPLDVIFGTIATLISCLLMIRLKNIVVLKRPLLSLLVPPIVNGIVIGLELAIYLSPNSETLKYLLIYGTYVFIGEFISETILGFVFYKNIENFLQKQEIN